VDNKKKSPKEVYRKIMPKKAAAPVKKPKAWVKPVNKDTPGCESLKDWPGVCICIVL
jgi:hypothetical protein